MAERDDELMQLKARLTELEAHPSATDLDWLKNSNVWRRAELATSPAFIRLNAMIVLGGIALFFGIPLVHIIMVKLQNG